MRGEDVKNKSKSVTIDRRFGSRNMSVAPLEPVPMLNNSREHGVKSLQVNKIQSNSPAALLTDFTHLGILKS